MVNINDVTEGRSEYEREHRYTMTGDLSYEFFEGSPTKLRIFALRQSGQPYSYVFTNNPFGGNGQTFQSNNIERAVIKGIELKGRLELGGVGAPADGGIERGIEDAETPGR